MKNLLIWVKSKLLAKTCSLFFLKVFMVDLVKGSNEQMVEYVTLKVLKFKVEEWAKECSSAKNYLISVEKALSYYHIIEDDRYWKLLAIIEDDNDFKNNLGHLKDWIYHLDNVLNKSIKWFFYLLAGCFLLFGLFGSLFTLESVFFLMMLLISYVMFCLSRVNKITQPLSNFLFIIVQNSGMTYGKRVPL